MAHSPSLLLSGGHVQTFMCAFPYVPQAQAAAPIRRGARWFPAAGGEVLVRTAYIGEEPRPTVVLVHGVGGDDGSAYVKRAEIAFLDAGYHVLSMNQRGAGDSAVRASGLYHVGLTADLDTVLRTLARESRHAGVFAVGFSGGGNVVLKLAAEWATAAPSGVGAMASLSAPLDLARTAANIERLDKTPYRMHVLRGLLRGARHFVRFQPERAHYTFGDLLAVRNLRDFDRIVTVPMHGFADVDAYYAEAGAGPMLGQIHVPSIAVHAADDPMVPSSTVADALANASSAVRVVNLARGGHLGFIEDFSRAGFTRTRALDAVMTFFDEHGAANDGKGETPSMRARASGFFDSLFPQRHVVF